MSHMQFKLDKFEGPLDLLLHLISKHKLNIYDIEITVLLEQYMDYINNLEHEDYEDAADFLEMAARLIYIKTCSLLPHDEEAQELKKELEGNIINYSLCKQAAAALREFYAGGLIFVRKPQPPTVNRTYTRLHEASVLYEAYMGLSEKAKSAVPLKAGMFEPIVSHKIVSVTSKIIFVLKKLYTGGECSMEHLYDGMTGKSEKVATFLAILELTKSGRIYLNDDSSMLYFNKNSVRQKKEKSESEFDKNDKSDVPVEQKIDENKSEENDNKAVKFPDESIINTESADNKEWAEQKRFDEERTQKHLSSAHAAKSETIACERISVEFCVNDEIDSDAETVEETDFETVDEVEKFEEVENTCEIELLRQLADITPYGVFKPNFWNFTYYYGNPTAVQSGNNCWKYGNRRC